MKLLVALAMTVLSFAAKAQNRPEPFVNCWDGSFAYTQTKITDDGGYLQFDFQSEQQDQFKEFTVPGGPIAHWGRAEITMILPKAGCVITGQQVNCNVTGGNLTFAYDESAESRRILREVVSTVTFSGQVWANMYMVNLQFMKVGGTNAESLHLHFPLNDKGECMQFQH